MRPCISFCFVFVYSRLAQTELSHNLQQLSEKARSTTEFIQRLKGMSDKVTVCIIIIYPRIARPCTRHVIDVDFIVVYSVCVWNW